MEILITFIGSIICFFCGAIVSGGYTLPPNLFDKSDIDPTDNQDDIKNIMSYFPNGGEE